MALSPAVAAPAQLAGGTAGWRAVAALRARALRPACHMPPMQATQCQPGSMANELSLAGVQCAGCGRGQHLGGTGMHAGVLARALLPSWPGPHLPLRHWPQLYFLAKLRAVWPSVLAHPASADMGDLPLPCRGASGMRFMAVAFMLGAWVRRPLWGGIHNTAHANSRLRTLLALTPKPFDALQRLWRWASLWCLCTRPHQGQRPPGALPAAAAALSSSPPGPAGVLLLSCAGCIGTVFASRERCSPHACLRTSLQRCRRRPVYNSAGRRQRARGMRTCRSQQAAAMACLGQRAAHPRHPWPSPAASLQGLANSCNPCGPGRL